jgi:hypothetical protein
MTDLTDLLDRASDRGEPPLPVADDLTRGRVALRRRRRRNGLVAVGSLCALGIIAGFGAPAVLDRSSDDRPSVGVEKSESALFAANQTEGPYTFGKLPVGWEVQGSYPQGVTIAPVGFPDQEPASFVGKLVIMYDQNPVFGERREYNDREFYSNTEGDHDTVRVRTRAGEPEGTVSVQYPDSAGWDVETMIEFLDAVEVGQGALPGLG